MEPIITVIIPVYNGEKYVKRAVESVVQQPEADAVEVIIVNDGSTDESGRICDELANEYANVRAQHKDNGGVSSARNQGIKHVKTKYVAFLDCDDWWEPDFLDASLVEEFSKNDSADVYQFAYQEINHSCSLAKLFPVKDEEKNYSEPELGRYIWSHPCSFVYKASLLKTYQIMYPIAKVGEDNLFVDMALFHAKKFKRINKVVFSYWENLKSRIHTTGAITAEKEKYKAFQQEQEYLEKYGAELDAEITFVWSIAANLPRICAENDFQTVMTFMDECCIPILDRRPDIHFREELQSRLVVWRQTPKRYWRKYRICIGFPLRVKQLCYQIPGVNILFNYLYNLLYRGFVPYKALRDFGRR